MPSRADAITSAERPTKNGSTGSPQRSVASTAPTSATPTAAAVHRRDETAATV